MGGNDSILAGDGNDVVNGGQGNDLIDGGDGDDLIQGGSTGDDTIHAGAGADVIFGEDGADLIAGGDGADSLAGDNGNDIFFYTSEAQLENGTGLVDSAINGGANTDRISVADGLNIANTVSFANATSIEELYVTGTAASSIALDLTAQTAGINTINIATATANSIVNASEFTTTGVNITGGTANDTLTGGSGADTITGGAGNDTVILGAGADVLVFGGSGALGAVTGTAAQVATNLGSDNIFGYNVADDSIHLSQASFGSTATGAVGALSAAKFSNVPNVNTIVGVNYSAGGFLFEEGNRRLYYTTADMTNSSTDALVIGVNAAIIGTFIGFNTPNVVGEFIVVA